MRKRSCLWWALCDERGNGLRVLVAGFFGACAIWDRFWFVMFDVVGASTVIRSVFSAAVAAVGIIGFGLGALFSGVLFTAFNATWS